MSNTLHAFEFLEPDQAIGIPQVVVLFGDENFLKIRSLGKLRSTLLTDQNAEINFSKMEGSEACWKDLRDDLATVSLFGGGDPRVVYLSDADKFVSEFRDELESWVVEGCGTGVLILDVGQWRSNTRLYKSIDKSGLQVDCRPPTNRKGKAIDFRSIAKWASRWAAQEHRVKLSQLVAEHLIDLVGPELGIIDQSLAKLSLYLDSKTTVTVDHVNEYVGGWQVKTVWELIDLALSAKTGDALTMLDRLLQHGDSPIALFGQIGWSLRRVASAFEAASRYSRKGLKQNTTSVLESAGFRYPADQKKAIEQLKRIGRKRGVHYYKMLLECDLALKSSHSSEPRSRMALEKLIFGLVDHRPTR